MLSFFHGVGDVNSGCRVCSQCVSPTEPSHQIPVISKSLPLSGGLPQKEREQQRIGKCEATLGYFLMRGGGQREALPEPMETSGWRTLGAISPAGLDDLTTT